MAILMWQGGDLQEVSAECPHLLKEGQKTAPSCGGEGSCRVLIGVTGSEVRTGLQLRVSADSF